MTASRPNINDQLRLEDEHKRVAEDILLLKTTLHQLREALPRASTKQELGTLAGAIVSVMECIVILEKKQLLNTLRLSGLTKSAIVTPPTLPAEAAGPSRGLWSIISALGALCLLIGAALVRRAWFDLQGIRGPARCI